MSKIIAGRLYYRYAGTYRTRGRALDRIESMYAEGDISPCDDPQIIREGNGYAIYLRDPT